MPDERPQENHTTNQKSGRLNQYEEIKVENEIGEMSPKEELNEKFALYVIGLIHMVDENLCEPDGLREIYAYVANVLTL